MGNASCRYPNNRTKHMACCEFKKNQHAENDLIKAELIYVESNLYKIFTKGYYGNIYEGDVYKLIVTNKKTGSVKMRMTRQGYAIGHELFVTDNTAYVKYATDLSVSNVMELSV